MKLGFILSNYKAKLQIEIRSLSKKLESKKLFDKIFVNYKIKRIIKDKEQLLDYVDNYIKYLEKNDMEKLEKKVSLNKELKNISKVSDLENILTNI